MRQGIIATGVFIAGSALFFGLGHFYSFSDFVHPNPTVPGDLIIAPTLYWLEAFWWGTPGIIWGILFDFYLFKVMRLYALVNTLLVLFLLSLLACQAYFDFKTPGVFKFSILVQVCFVIIGWIAGLLVKILLSLLKRKADSKHSS